MAPVRGLGRVAAMLARHVLAAAAVAALLAPAAAQAATETVYAGPPVAKAKALRANSTGNAFYDPVAHGGFLTTGLIDADRRTSFPRSASVTFPKPGTYAYICAVHGPTMKGAIEVS